MNIIQEKIKELKELADQELEFCNIHDTPYICSAIQNPINKVKILDQIVEIVAKRGYTISNAIYEIERELNPQITI
jgi:hypothetical protein